MTAVRPILKHRALTVMRASLVGVMISASGANAAGVLETVYFDISFSSPLHRVGSRPTTRAGSAAPTMISFGSPEVVSGFGALANQPVVLNTAGNSGSFAYDQFQLTLGHQQPTYHIAFDVYTEGMIGSSSSFGVLLDLESVAKLGFYPSGILYPPCFPGPSPLPMFADGSLLHIDLSLDLANNRSVTLVNGVVVGDGQAIGNLSPGDLKSVRFSLGGGDTARIGIDNIRVTNGFVVPECGSSVLLLLAAGCRLACRAR